MNDQKNKTPIHDFLLTYKSKSPIRCHMPGGKENPLDITEIDGADSLFESSGIIKSSEETAASLFGAGKTLYSCGGSTLAIQTMLALAKACNPHKNRVAASRYCHKSLVSACILLDLEIDWITPSSFLSCEISPKAAEMAITDSTLCVFAQSIDYYGGECDIAALSEVCKSRSIPLLVDNAHGAYRVFTQNHPLLLGADLTADSAHKTLPCLTGGAYLHINKNAPEFFSERAKEMMSFFGSSSPSYLILDSLDLCNRHIALEKDKAENTMEQIKRLKADLSNIGAVLRQSDPMRITIDAEKWGYSGFDLSRALADHNIICEYADQKYTVLLFSTAQPLSDFPKISAAFRKIPKKAPFETALPSLSVPEPAAPLAKAVFSPSEEISLNNAEGRICGAIIAPCPPCVPVIMPGEIFTEKEISALKIWEVKKVRALLDTPK